jgi:dTDP-4-dehydrorhamnose reductase
MPPILVAGASGALARAFAARCKARNLPCVLAGRDVMDATDAEAVERLIRQHRPWAIVNAAGSRPPAPGMADAGQMDGQYRDHVAGAMVLALAAARHDLPYQVFSSTAVLAGVDGPRDESATPMPLDAFGHCQAEAERRVLGANPRALIVRSGQFFSADGDVGLLGQALASLRDGQPVALPPDLVLAPSYLPDLVDACLDLAVDGEQGIWHPCNDGGVPAIDLVARAAALLGLGTLLVQHDVDDEPVVPVLETRRGALLPTLDFALARFAAASQAAAVERRGVPRQGRG